MKRALAVTLAVSSSLSTAGIAAANEVATAPARGGAVAIDHEALVAFVADADAKALHRVDLLSHEVRTTALPCTPEQALVLDGAHVAVTLRGCSRVAIVSYDDEPDGAVVAAIEVASDPFALASTPGGDILVTSAWGHALTALAYDGNLLSVKYTVPLAKEPRGVVVTRDGARAFISHVSGDAVSVVDLAGAGERPRARSLDALGARYRNLVDHDAGSTTEHPRSSLAYAIAMNESGTRVFVPHVAVQIGEDVSHVVSSGYGSVRVEDDTSVPSVAVLSARDGEVLGAPPRDESAQPSRTPARAGAVTSPPAHLARAPRARIPTSGFAFAVTPLGSPARQARAAAVLGDHLYVASLGTDELVDLDARSLDPALAVVRRIPVAGGPTGLDVDATTGVAVVWGQFDHTLSIVSLGSGGVESVRLSGDTLADDVAAGRRLFYTDRDARTSRDGRACAACHPDGREDGLVWRLDAGPRQTPMLVGRLDHGPFGWMAKHDTLEGNMQETMTRLGGAGLPQAELTQLAAYLKEGLAAPAREASSDPRVARGKELFTSTQTGCTNCHREAEEFSDRNLHDIASKAPGDESTKFRTPPLLFLEGTAPYFHDGRYATLEALLDDDLDRMGNTTQLTRDDRDALAAYLRTL
jgi:mono/diheme cytochrome c family protein